MPNSDLEAPSEEPKENLERSERFSDAEEKGFQRVRNRKRFYYGRNSELVGQIM